MPESEEEIKEKKKRSLKYSIIDGAFYSAMVGFGESFFSAFAVFLNATNFQLGLIGSLPQALGSIVQLFSNRLIKIAGSRKWVVFAGAILQGLMYILISAVFFLGELRLSYLIFFISLYWIFGSIISPAWNSWMGDLVDERERGKYFGRRNEIAGIFSFSTFVIGGFLLQRFAEGYSKYLGFVLLFTVALCSRIASATYLARKYEPKYAPSVNAHFTFIEFLQKARSTNFGLLAIYLSVMNFAVYLAAPFFTAFMLNDLKFDYMTYTMVTAASLIVKYLTMPIWGKATDRFGAKKVLTLTGFLMPVVPIFWIFSHNIFYLYCIQALSGFFWAGFEISSFNFIFDTTSAEKRARCIAFYNVLSGIFLLAGSLIGSVIIRYNNVFWSKYLLVFLLSGVIRYIASFIFIPRLKEVREVEKIPYSKLLISVMTTMPNMGIIHHIVTFDFVKKK